MQFNLSSFLGNLVVSMAFDLVGSPNLGSDLCCGVQLLTDLDTGIIGIVAAQETQANKEGGECEFLIHGGVVRVESQSTCFCRGTALVANAIWPPWQARRPPYKTFG